MGSLDRNTELPDVVALHRQMLLIRRFEEAIERLYKDGAIHGGTHLYKGQEAVAVGVCAALRSDDVATYTYRSHGVVLARGMRPFSAFAEMLGRADGCNKGKGGSMHLKDLSIGLYGAFAIVGAGIPISVGLARAAQLDKSDRVSVTFFGDGATNIGAFHESLNMAAALRAPVVFVCENNLYGEYTPMATTTMVRDLAVRANSYGFPGVVVDGNDVLAVHEAAAQAIAHARAGSGPTLLECKTYRQCGHGAADQGLYRTQEEVRMWMARDPLIGSREQIRVRSLLDDGELAALDREVTEEIEDAVRQALQSPEPDVREVTTDVYA
jgi:pyruvate dehydrogenase E1 component alpha subunit